MEYFVYILRSLSNPGKTYVGFTSNLILRMREHNITDQFKGAYTKKFRPWEVIYIEYCCDKSEAMQRERWFKSGVGREWIKGHIESWGSV